LSALNRNAPQRRFTPPQESPAHGGKWPSLKPAAQDARSRPESEWAAFETLRPTDAMLARAAASSAGKAYPSKCIQPLVFVCVASSFNAVLPCFSDSNVVAGQ
jgi:hypothetical protein